MPPIPRWLPNAISFVRMLLVPVWVACAELANRTAQAASGGDPGGHEAAARYRLATAAVLVTIGLSDVLDGWLARRFGLQSRLGAVVDAGADKLAQVVLTTYLALRVGPAFPPIPLWFLGLLIARDGLLLVGLVVIRRRTGRVETEHELHGKVSSLCLFAVLVACSFAAPEAVTAPLVWGSAVVVVGSRAAYVWRGVRQLRG